MENLATSERKKDHIELAFQSVVSLQDSRFYYEPMLAAHPTSDLSSISFLGKSMKMPLWVSSMTGGTKEANTINQNLASACGEFGLGMGLGSCRIILEDNTYLPDFQLRKLIGDYPFYANLGIAQLEELFTRNKTHLISELISKTETDGLIIHVNPLQEWMQPEGDKFLNSPIDTIKRCLDLGIKCIVKEVGQGFGPKSLEALMKLPLQAIDFGAHGGTNFSLLEMHRSTAIEKEIFSTVPTWGHTAAEMVEFYNTIVQGKKHLAGDVIISGGIKNFTDGYYVTQKINTNAVYGMASSFLKYSRGAYEDLAEFVKLQQAGLAVAHAFLTVK